MEGYDVHGPMLITLADTELSQVCLWMPIVVVEAIVCVAVDLHRLILQVMIVIVEVWVQIMTNLLVRISVVLGLVEIRREVLIRMEEDAWIIDVFRCNRIKGVRRLELVVLEFHSMVPMTFIVMRMIIAWEVIVKVGAIVIIVIHSLL